MKILFIASKYDYGNPKFGLSYEYYNLYDSLVNMNNKEHKVVFFPFDEISQKFGNDEMNVKLLKEVDIQKPDLCFFFLANEEIKKETVKKIKDSGKTKTFNWFADDRWRFDNFSKYWAPFFDWVSTDQPSTVKKYHKIGYNNVVVGAWACNENIYKPLDLPKIYDVSFVGQPHGDRIKIINAIKKAGIKIECFGRGWPNGKISQENMVKVFNQSKINLNLSACSGKVNILKAIGRIFALKENDKLKFYKISMWLGNFKTFLSRQKMEIKGRIFEIPGCKAFLLTDYADGLQDYYKINEEIGCFYGKKDLVKKIKYYLDNTEEREKIENLGYQKTLKSHTYEKRLNYIFKIIFA